MHANSDKLATETALVSLKMKDLKAFALIEVICRIHNRDCFGLN